jgi:hypothetical protein
MRYSAILLDVDDALTIDVPQHKDAVVGFFVQPHTSQDALALEGLFGGETTYVGLNPNAFDWTVAPGSGQGWSGIVIQISGYKAKLFDKVRIRKYGLGAETATAIPVIGVVRGIGV